MLGFISKGRGWKATFKHTVIEAGEMEEYDPGETPGRAGPFKVNVPRFDS